jgi:hypothetical protein
MNNLLNNFTSSVELFLRGRGFWNCFNLIPKTSTTQDKVENLSNKDG